MFNRILVPLDGSNLAEAALPPATSLAQNLGAPVTLLHVIEKDAPQEIHRARHLTRPDEAEAYLREVAGKSFSKETQVDWHVHTAEVKDVTASLAEHADEFAPELIILCAHGSGGIRKLFFGTIAQQVVAQGTTPVLMLQPRTAQPKVFRLKKILVPLDSESIHDDGLPFAKTLAQAYAAEIYLLTVIPTLGTLSGEQAATGNLMPTAAAAALDMKEEAAKEHLQTHLDDLYKAGFKASAEIARGDPAQTIPETGKRIGADLILLSTHRKAGMDAFWARSVAPNVARRTRIPLMLIPLE